MPRIKRNHPTVGVLAGWQSYAGTIHSFLDHVYRGIQAAARDFDCKLIFGCAVTSPLYQHETQLMPVSLPGADFIPVGSWNTEGMLVAGPLFNDSADRFFQELIDSGFPVVYAGDRETGPSVTVDNKGGIEMAVDHLIEHGHRRIAYIAGYETSLGDSAERWRGYRTSLRRHKINYDPDLVAVGKHSTATSYLAMKEIITKGKPFSAVIGSNDEAAVGAIQALRDYGLVVPQDIAVIGFDDRLEARAELPLLTTVHHPMFELGYQSLELLYQIINGQAPSDSLVRIPTHLVIRESCGCLPGHQPLNERSQTSLKDFVQPVYYPDFHGPYRYETGVANLATHVIKKKISPEIPTEMAELVHREMQRMGSAEVEYLCQRLLDAFLLSLQQSEPAIFQLAMQQILDHVAALDGDLHAWHGAVNVLQRWSPVLVHNISPPAKLVQAENLLHQARIAISEILRGQYSRWVRRESTNANLISQMSARFFSAKDEADIFEILNDFTHALNIQNVAIAYYLPDRNDPYALSEIKTPLPENGQSPIFPTRDFPPEGLFPDDQPVQLVLLPLFKPDGMLGYAAFQTNDLAPLGQIVHQVVAALHNVDLHQETVEARKQAEVANEQKSRFLSVVSHELRTPLSLIFGLSNMLLEESEAVNEQERLVNVKDLQRIYFGAQHLESLIRDVLDLARSDVGQIKLTLESVNLKEVLEGVAEIGKQLAHDKELDWHTDIQADLPPVKADRTRLRQIVLNLVNNAVKFTVHGCITLSAYTGDGEVVIAIRDTGIGIPKDDQCAIFDEFHQSKRTTARGYGGLGLGLAICKRLVEMQGGSIWVSSNGYEGPGSVFYFSLPINESLAVASHQPNDPLVKRILILVKELENSATLKNHLTRLGYKVDLHRVEISGDWLPLLQTQMPERILLDLELTSESGWETLKALKENPSTRDIPILFYTLKNEQDQGALLDLNFMAKPLNSVDLAAELTSRGITLHGSNCETTRPILIADDDPEILDLHTRILETVSGGHTILHARNGREALEIIRHQRPALVLLDLMMPEIDGFEVLEAMQAEDLSHSTPVIILTGQILTEADMARLNAGVASVLGKGMFTAEETLSHVANALTQNRKLGSEAHRMVLKAIVYLHNHYKDPISRSDIASHIGISERHLARCFQQAMGVTPITYLNRFRVKMAKSMLLNQQKSITDIAMEVGFSTSGYFARVFREEEGVTPREYLRGRDSS